MKITKKSFQAFFARASFAGLLLVAGATGARAQAVDAVPAEDSFLSGFTLERIFSWSGPARKSPVSTETAAWYASLVAPGAAGRVSPPDAYTASDFSSKAGSLPSFAPIGGIFPSPSATVLTSGSLTPTASLL